MRLYERLGFPEEKIRVDICKAAFVRMKTGPIQSVQLLPDIKAEMVSLGSQITHYYYLLEETAHARTSASDLLRYALEYFFGAWMQEIPNYPTNTQNWTEQYRQCICWGSCIDAWEEVHRLAEYPKHAVIEAEAWEPLEWRSWYLLVAGVLRGESLRDLGQYARTIEVGKKKRERLLLRLLAAILDGDASTSQRCLNKYLKYYRQYEFPKPTFDKVSIDGTFLVNFARLRGLDISFPSGYRDHFIDISNA